MQLHEVDFNENWLATDSKGNLWIAPKNPIFIRWIKYFIQLLTGGCVRAFDHIRIDRVSKAILFQYHRTTDEQTRENLRKVVVNLTYSHAPIRTYRKALNALRKELAIETS